MGIGNIALPLAGTALRSAFACTGGSSPRARGALHLLMTEMAPAEQPSRSLISPQPMLFFLWSQGRDGYQTKPKKSQNCLDLAVSNCVRRRPSASCTATNERALLTNHQPGPALGCYFSSASRTLASSTRGHSCIVIHGDTVISER